MSFALPMEKRKPTHYDPRSLLIYGKPKVGKTTSLSALQGGLIMDLESGSAYVEAIVVDVKSINDLEKLFIAIQKYYKEHNKMPYQYGIIDTITALEELIIPLAGKIYRGTLAGKNFPESGDVRNIPNGYGHRYIRMAFTEVTKNLSLHFPRVIYVGHVKDKNIAKNDNDQITVDDINLTGALKSIITSKIDAIGQLSRRGNKNYLSFKTDENLAIGNRCPHLSDKEFVISEKLEDGTVISHWGSIFTADATNSYLKEGASVTKVEDAKNLLIKYIDGGKDVDTVKSSLLTSDKFNPEEVTILLDFVDEYVSNSSVT